MFAGLTLSLLSKFHLVGIQYVCLFVCLCLCVRFVCTCECVCAVRVSVVQSTPLQRPQHKYTHISPSIRETSTVNIKQLIDVGIREVILAYLMRYILFIYLLLILLLLLLLAYIRPIIIVVVVILKQ